MRPVPAWVQARRDHYASTQRILRTEAEVAVKLAAGWTLRMLVLDDKRTFPFVVAPGGSDCWAVELRLAKRLITTGAVDYAKTTPRGVKVYLASERMAA